MKEYRYHEPAEAFDEGLVELLKTAKEEPTKPKAPARESGLHRLGRTPLDDVQAVLARKRMQDPQASALLSDVLSPEKRAEYNDEPLVGTEL